MSAPDSAWQGPYTWRVTPSGRLYRAVPLTEEFIAEWRAERREWALQQQARQRRGELGCPNKHEHLDVYGGSCDECRAAR